MQRRSAPNALHTSTRAGAPQYGYKWWLYTNPVQPNAFIWAGSGFGGQFPMAFPDLEMVVVFNAWNISGGPTLPLRAVQERLIRAAK